MAENIQLEVVTPEKTVVSDEAQICLLYTSDAADDL